VPSPESRISGTSPRHSNTYQFQRNFMHRRTVLLGLSALAMSSVTPVQADDVTSGNLMINNAFARSSPMMAHAGAGFLSIANHGAADRLVAFKTDVCEKPELHTHIEENGMMAMRKVDAIDVPEHGTVDLKPGSFHLMFIGLKAPLQEGSTVAVTLVFEKAGEVLVTLPVRAPGAMN
jgi:copper(I)-binding protein